MSKIFIIDEDANTLFALQAKINLAGHKAYPLHHNSSDAALHQLRLISPDFLIIEPNLNIFDGIQFIRQAKTDSEVAHIPIFIFSNSKNQDDKTRMLDLGASLYFNKADFIIDDFVNKLTKIISNLYKK